MSSLSARKQLKEALNALNTSILPGSAREEGEKLYDVIVAGGVDKKSVEHILLPAKLRQERNMCFM